MTHDLSDKTKHYRFHIFHCLDGITIYSLSDIKSGDKVKIKDRIFTVEDRMPSNREYAKTNPSPPTYHTHIEGLKFYEFNLKQ